MNNNHWETIDYRGDIVAIDLCYNERADLFYFNVMMNRGNEIRVQTYEVFTEHELERRLKFLNEGKNPCGKWTDRNGKRMCFENGTPVC